VSKQRWTEDLNGWEGLDYLRLVGVPMYKSKKGPLIDLRPKQLERMVACAVVQSRNPLTGTEVKFLRKSIGLSLDKFGRKLGITSGAIFHWEKTANIRLLPINEIAVRVLCADELGVEMSAKLSRMIGKPSGLSFL
jgi:DNA-binding XRE family transcriptional regulator